jgi:outer membrane protein OmpA-like peptidoglycan-associated protein
MWRLGGRMARAVRLLQAYENNPSIQRSLAVVVLAAFGVLAVGLPACSRAQTETVTTSPMTAEEVAVQELQLKQKILELEKAKMVQQQTEALAVQKAQLELEIKKLELAKARRDLQVQETAQKLSMLVQGDVLFDTGEAVIKPSAAVTLRQVALLLMEFPEGKVQVTGFADSTGDSDMNLELSRKRAEAVKTYLLTKSGISSDRVITIGMGEELPVASNMNATGRQLNRRVEITIVKLAS